MSHDEDRFNLLKEENSIRARRIEEIISERFHRIDALKVIEIGAGSGKNGALLSKKGASVTILDYSEKALQRSREFFCRNGLEAEFICANALDLPADLRGKYDIAISFGLSEHFRGEERVQINRTHFDLIKKGGVAFISVPNSYNLPYRIYKLTAETLGMWRVGEEYPYTRKELAYMCKKYGIENYTFIGDSIYWSLNFINPLKYLNKVIRKSLRLRPDYSWQRIKPEKGSPLDEYFSYSLVLCAFKS